MPSEREDTPKVVSPGAPRRPVLVYDGDCGFCTSAVRLVGRLPADADVVAFQLADLDALGTTAERAGREVLWVQDGRVYGGAQAVAALLVHAGGPWRALGLIARVPPLSWLARAGYALIAANRHRLPGGTPACALPAGERPGTRPLNGCSTSSEARRR
jgi:predicted DCC family thiol-disulfide oxidoreductase YuxK